MTRAVSFCFFVGIITCLSVARSDEANLNRQFEDFKVTVLQEIKRQENYLQKLDNSVNALVRDNLSAPRTGTTSQQSLDNVVDTVKKLSIEVEALGTKMKSVSSKVEALDTPLNNRLLSTNLLGSAQHGLILGTSDGVNTISLPSMHQSKIFGANARRVAFDWNARQIYWTDDYLDIKRANLDGTDMENVAQGTKVNTLAFDVDSTTGNMFYGNVSSSDIRVCTRNQQMCSILAHNQTHVRDISLLPSKSLIFWTNNSSIVRANMDGSADRIIVPERVSDIHIDESEDRLYWIDWDQRFIRSSDLNGNDRKELFRSTSNDLRGITTNANNVIFGKFRNGTVESMSKEGGKSSVIASQSGEVRHIAMYGSQEPLRGILRVISSPCSHLCAFKWYSFACLGLLRFYL